MQTKKPRIAFCFSWQARTLDQTYLFYKWNVFDAAKEQWFEYDIFCAVEDDEDKDKIKILNPVKIELIKSSDVEIDIKNVHQDYINKHLNNDFSFCRSRFWIERSLQQFYKIERSIKIKEEYQTEHKITYDIVCRLRFDTIFISKINFNKIFKNVRNSVIWIDCYDWYSRKYWKIQDFFLFWNENDMNKLWNLYSSFSIALKWWEIKCKILYKIVNFFIELNLSLNKFLWHRIFPVVPLEQINSLYSTVFTTESIFYYFIINQWIKVKKEKFSFIILRKNQKDSLIRISDKWLFEL